MKVKLENGESFDIPDVGKFDEFHVIYNGGGALYIKENGKWSCPVCGSYTLAEPGENYICPVCRWEDDRMDCIMSDTAIGMNPISLNQARELWEKYHDSFKNHQDEWKLTFGIPEIDRWIEESEDGVTEEELLAKLKEYFGDSEDEEEVEEETEETENS